jgi:hypothetical protein
VRQCGSGGVAGITFLRFCLLYHFPLESLPRYLLTPYPLCPLLHQPQEADEIVRPQPAGEEQWLDEHRHDEDAQHADAQGKAQRRRDAPAGPTRPGILRAWLTRDPANPTQWLATPLPLGDVPTLPAPQAVFAAT